MDIGGWARVVARLLRPEGLLYVFDGHPLTWVWDSEAPEFRLDPQYGDNFSETVAVSEDWPAQYMPASAGPLGPPPRSCLPRCLTPCNEKVAVCRQQ